MVFNILDIKTPIEIETSLGEKKTKDIVKIQFKDRDENEYVKFMYLVESHQKNENNSNVYRGITEYNLTYEFSNTTNRGIVYHDGNGFREVLNDGDVNSTNLFDDYHKTLDEVKEIEQNGYKEHKLEEHQEYNSNSMHYLEQNDFFDSLDNSVDILNSVYGASKLFWFCRRRNRIL